MLFDVYGRYRLEVVRQGGAWAVYRRDGGRRRPLPGLVVPAAIAAADVGIYLDDMLHEQAGPGQVIRRID